VSIAVTSALATIAVASLEPFDFSDWMKQQPEDKCPDEHRGLWLCRQMLKSLHSEMTQLDDPKFGCVLQFSVPLL
jgi:hypothetical protein